MLAGVVIDTSAAKPVTPARPRGPGAGRGGGRLRRRGRGTGPPAPAPAAAAAHPRRRHAPGEAVRRGVHAFAAELRPAASLGVGASLMLTHVTRFAFMFISAAMLVYAYPAVGRGGWRTFWRRRLLAVVLPYATWTVIYFASAWPRPAHRERRRRRRSPGLAAAHGLRPAVLPGRAAAVLPDLPGVPVAHPAHRAAPLVAARRQPRARGGAVLARARAATSRPGC